MNKMEKKGLMLDFDVMQENILDIAGIRVVCSFSEDVFFLADCLRSQTDIAIISEKDYITQPKSNGYRSFHITVRIPVYFAREIVFVPVEIQLRTIAMDFWASLEHTIRYKKDFIITDEISNQLKNCAVSSAVWDEKMEHLMHLLYKS